MDSFARRRVIEKCGVACRPKNLLDWNLPFRQYLREKSHCFGHSRSVGISRASKRLLRLPSQSRLGSPPMDDTKSRRFGNRPTLLLTEIRRRFLSERDVHRREEWNEPRQPGPWRQAMG